MHPFLGKWAIPGGFLRIDESADEAAARRIREESLEKGTVGRPAMLYRFLQAADS